MIPYFQFNAFVLGPFTIHVWGLFASLGFLTAVMVAARRARWVGLDSNGVWGASWQVIVASMVGSRIFEVLFYEPAYYWAHPSKIFAVWDGGLSSTGGIIGGGLALLWYIRRHRLDYLRTLDIFAYAAPLGLMFGRIGCFFIKDHPGTITTVPWSVRYPDGMVRHDGGLEMAIADGLIFLLFVLLAKIPSPRVGEGRGEVRINTEGLWILLFLGLKGFSRFWLDFYRATDIVGAEARYAGLTPSQYVGILSVGIALVLFIVVMRRQRRSTFTRKTIIMQ